MNKRKVSKKLVRAPLLRRQCIFWQKRAFKCYTISLPDLQRRPSLILKVQMEISLSSASKQGLLSQKYRSKTSVTTLRLGTP